MSVPDPTKKEKGSRGFRKVWKATKHVKSAFNKPKTGKQQESDGPSSVVHVNSAPAQPTENALTAALSAATVAPPKPDPAQQGQNGYGGFDPTTGAVQGSLEAEQAVLPEGLREDLQTGPKLQHFNKDRVAAKGPQRRPPKRRPMQERNLARAEDVAPGEGGSQLQGEFAVPTQAPLQAIPTSTSSSSSFTTATLDTSMPTQVGTKKVLKVFCSGFNINSVTVTNQMTVDQVIKLIRKRLYDVDTTDWGLFEVHGNVPMREISGPNIVLAQAMSRWEETTGQEFKFIFQARAGIITKEPPLGGGLDAGVQIPILPVTADNFTSQPPLAQETQAIQPLVQDNREDEQQQPHSQDNDALEATANQIENEMAALHAPLRHESEKTLERHESSQLLGVSCQPDATVISQSNDPPVGQGKIGADVAPSQSLHITEAGVTAGVFCAAQSHTRTGSSQFPCDRCDLTGVDWKCSNCDTPLCERCVRQLHARGTWQLHQIVPAPAVPAANPLSLQPESLSLTQPTQTSEPLQAVQPMPTSVQPLPTVKPMPTAQPAIATEPVQPTQPAIATEPVQPAIATEPVQPTQPTQPIQVEQQPVQMTQTGQLAQSEPVQSVQPEPLQSVLTPQQATVQKPKATAVRHNGSMQNKCFSGWVTYCVAERGLSVTPSLALAMMDGVLLLSLLEVITGSSVEVPAPQPQTDAEKIANHRAAIAYVSSIGIDLGPQAKPEDLAKGDLRAILPLMWRLVYNCVQQGVLASGDEVSAKAILFDFMGDAAASCGVEPPQELEDLRDGRVFASVLAKYQPEATQAAGLSPITTALVPGAVETNVGKVLQYLKDVMNLPHILDTADFMKDLDERSLMTFSVVLYDWSMRNAVG